MTVSTQVTHHSSRARRGLTLIEVLIVIAILLAIGGLVLVNLGGKKEQADIDLTRVQMDFFDSALDQFKLNMNRYPTEDEGLSALWSKDAIDDEDEAAKWRGPYLRNPSPEDNWGNGWTYTYPGEIRGESFYDIVSFGPDGEEGTDDDITNHDRFRNAESEIDDAFDDFEPADVGTAPPS